jgi:hypothetical protein
LLCQLLGALQTQQLLLQPRRILPEKQQVCVTSCHYPGSSSQRKQQQQQQTNSLTWQNSWSDRPLFSHMPTSLSNSSSSSSSSKLLTGLGSHCQMDCTRHSPQLQQQQISHHPLQTGLQHSNSFRSAAACHPHQQLLPPDISSTASSNSSHPAGALVLLILCWPLRLPLQTRRQQQHQQQQQALAVPQLPKTPLCSTP